MAGCMGETILAADPAELPPIRGLDLIPENLTLPDWPGRAKRAGLNTIVLHHFESPATLLKFIKTDSGQTFLAQCRAAKIELEFDFHAMRDLVPRDLFEKN